MTFRATTLSIIITSITKLSIMTPSTAAISIRTHDIT
jgi:hypothetical protein